MKAKYTSLNCQEQSTTASKNSEAEDCKVLPAPGAIESTIICTSGAAWKLSLVGGWRRSIMTMLLLVEQNSILEGTMFQDAY